MSNDHRAPGQHHEAGRIRGIDEVHPGGQPDAAEKADGVGNEHQ
jgi:hypothetical protein